VDIRGYTIVVLGNMNPSIHHPVWYKDVGILDADAAKLAVSRPVLVTPQLATFELPDALLTCMPERWQLATREPSAAARERLIGFASKTFERLFDTPVTSFGLNVEVERQVQGLRQDTLGEILSSTPLGSVFGGKKAGVERVVLTHALDPLSTSEADLQRQLKFTISVLNEPAVCAVSANAHHSIKAKSFSFGLGALLKLAAPVWGQAAEHACGLIERLDRGH